jgi:hypothetical protein
MTEFPRKTQMHWLQGDPRDLPCCLAGNSSDNLDWIHGHCVMVRVFSSQDHSQPPIYELCDLLVGRTGTDVKAYFITAQSHKPTNGWLNVMFFDKEDAVAIKRTELRDGLTYSFELDWDLARDRKWTPDLICEINSAPLVNVQIRQMSP